MEHKIGEIKQVNGEWCQCIEGGCRDCYFSEKRFLCKQFITKNFCTSGIIFKKLEKVGEPYRLWPSPFNSIMVQRYRLYGRNVIMPDEPYMYFNAIDNTIEIEIKQTKEDMEERKLIELLSEKVHNAWMKEKEAQGFSYGKDYDKEKKKHPDMLPYNELKEEVKEYDRATVRAVLQAQKELQSKYNYNNLKPFDIQKAREGKPVCTRDGRKARILCYDLKGAEYPIVAAVETRDCFAESICGYDKNGRFDHNTENNNDLMMLSEKKEGWINVYKRESEYICENECNVSTGIAVYKSEGEAKRNIDKSAIYINTIKINWEE